MKWAILSVLLIGAACSGFPKDPNGTLDRVRATHRFKVGLIASGDTKPGRDVERAFVARVASATGARPVVTTGASERLLLALEQGKLDLVIGSMAPQTPWIARVAVIEPIGEEIGPHGNMAILPTAQMGENAWIMLLEKEARAVRAESGR